MPQLSSCAKGYGGSYEALCEVGYSQKTSNFFPIISGYPEAGEKMSERIKELSAYSTLWIDKPKLQVVEEIASYSLETKKIPDPYFFIIGDKGKLISPMTGIPVEKSVEKISVVGRKEFEALLKIQDWSAVKTDNEVAVWISPPFKNKYPTSKVIVSEKVNDTMLFNRAILLDLDEAECLNLACQLTSLNESSFTFVSHEELRGQPIFLKPPEETSWSQLLEKAIDSPETWKLINTQQDIREKEKALTSAEVIYSELFETAGSMGIENAFEKAVLLDTFGDHAVSCPPSSTSTAFETFYKNSLHVEGGKYVKNCGKCGKKIEKVIHAGHRCSKCGGTYEGC